MDDRKRDGGTNYILRTKEQGTHLTLNKHDDDDEIIFLPVLFFDLPDDDGYSQRPEHVAGLKLIEI